MRRFTAIDFETATHRRDSACAVGIAACRNGEFVASHSFLIRPPSRDFTMTPIHGLRWKDVCRAPTFAQLWPQLRGWINDAAFLAAHNAAFDRQVLHACCSRAGIPMPAKPFRCTVRLARQHWGIYPTKLSDVCHRLQIPLRHHEAGSDARACARIVLAAENDGWRYELKGRAPRESMERGGVPAPPEDQGSR